MSGLVPTNRVLQGILLMCLAIFLFNVLNAGGKFLSAGYTIAQIVWARYVGAFLFMAVTFMPRHGLNVVRTKRPVVQVVRGAMNLTSSFLFFTGVSLLPLTTAATITFTGPLIITALSVPFLKEAVGIRRWSAVFVGFIGALIVIRPGIGETDWAILFLVGSTFASAFYQLLSRKLASEDDPVTSSTITTIVGAVPLTFIVPFVWVTPADPIEIGLFLTIGVLAGIGHYCLTVAYQRGAAAVIAPFNYTSMLWATVLGYVIFGDFPDLWTWVGAAVIIAAGLYIVHRETVRGRSA